MAALRGLEAGGEAVGIPGSGAEWSQGAIHLKFQVTGKEAQRCVRIQIAKNRLVIDVGENEIVHDGRGEDVRVVQLAFVLGLNAGFVKRRVNGVGVGWLHAAIDADPPEKLVVVA